MKDPIVKISSWILITEDLENGSQVTSRGREYLMMGVVHKMFPRRNGKLKVGLVTVEGMYDKNNLKPLHPREIVEGSRLIFKDVTWDIEEGLTVSHAVAVNNDQEIFFVWSIGERSLKPYSNLTLQNMEVNLT